MLTTAFFEIAKAIASTTNPWESHMDPDPRLHPCGEVP